MGQVPAYQLPFFKRLAFRLRCGSTIVKQVFSRIKTAREMTAPPEQKGSDNFTLGATADLGVDITVHKLLECCLRENDKRLSVYPAQLARPRLVPSIAKFLYRVLPASI